MKSRIGKHGAFTLIELLIVIAIIAILALIAIPNFLEAQTRSKIAKVKADMRTLAIGLECYFVDHNTYPHIAGYVGFHDQWDRGGIALTWNLTTPVAYLTSVNLLDPFSRGDISTMFEVEEKQRSASIHYVNIYLTQHRASGTKTSQVYTATPAVEHWSRWLLLSLGPDYVKGPNPLTGGAGSLGEYSNPQNDPSNGKLVPLKNLWVIGA